MTATGECVFFEAGTGELMRIVMTGAPGAGKTTLLRELAKRGYDIVPEAATDIIATKHAEGVRNPSDNPLFPEWICALQRQRQEAADQRCREVESTRPLMFYDRSPVCTLALARFLGHPVLPRLAAELERIGREDVYRRDVFLVQPLGWVERTAARLISYPDTLRFAAVHVATYEELGYRLLNIPACSPAERADVVEYFLRHPSCVRSDGEAIA